MAQARHRLGTLYVTVASLGVGFACKPPARPSSEVKSLSNLEEEAKGGPRTQTQCAGYHEVNAGIEADGLVLGASTPALKDAVLKTMTALPSSVSFNFVQWGGKIAFRDDLSGVCKGGIALTTQSSKSEQGGCMVIKQGELTAYFKPDVNAVRYGLTRAFGYFVSVGTALSDVEGGALAFRKDEDPALKAYWDKLKSSFLAELKTRPGIDESSAAYRDVAAMDAFVFYQEAFDSQYCDGALRDKDEKAYPKTMGLLGREAAAFDLIDKAAERALKTRDTSELEALGVDLPKVDHAFKHWQVTQLTVAHYLANNGSGLNLQTAKIPRVDGAPIMNTFRGGANIFRPGPAAGKI